MALLRWEDKRGNSSVCTHVSIRSQSTVLIDRLCVGGCPASFSLLSRVRLSLMVLRWDTSVSVRGCVARLLRGVSGSRPESMCIFTSQNFPIPHFMLSLLSICEEIES